jgi:hypothetical protein
MDTNKSESGMNTGRVSSFLCGPCCEIYLFCVFSERPFIPTEHPQRTTPTLWRFQRCLAFNGGDD